VVLCVDVYEMTIDKAAKAIGCPLTTAADRLARARGMLRELALESERATEAGERRKC
jgi:DNA-directed RNA polymerase specialized sigma24 family protein